MVQAPTGVGKTIGTLFPLLKAMPRSALDKIFFLVAKTSGREPALAALKRVSQNGAASLRVLELVAKDGACQYPGRPCEAASCPLAKGFYDRLSGARAVALQSGHLDQQSVNGTALAHRVCPYYLSLELARWSDVIVGDYNYFFDTSAFLHALTQQNSWRIGALVDEGHNLLARARDMYSASLKPAVLDLAMLSATGPVKRQLMKLRLCWRSIDAQQVKDYAVQPSIPASLTAQLQRAAESIADGCDVDPSGQDQAVLRFYFDALHFCRLADDFGAHSLFDVTREGADSTLCLRNINPGPFLAARFAAAKTSILFSATLAPSGYYRRLLGLPVNSNWTSVRSPFTPCQLDVRVAGRISTRYRDRACSLAPIAELMALQFRSRPGNYLAFFSSFEYLGMTLRAFTSHAADIPVWEQTKRMPLAARTDFLARFTLGGRGIGFAVLGGAFAEGIDLPGDRLIGAFIATLGLPQVNELNAEIARRMQTLFGAGHDYAYLYPGLQKVIQAAGRVIRTPTDRGIVVLMDDRYLEPKIQALLPDWWNVKCS